MQVFLYDLRRLLRNNGQMTWTYNQGVILSGLSKLYKYTLDPEIFNAAQNLIDSVLASSLVSTPRGILVESSDPSWTSNQDQWMFKGIFFQHLGWLLEDLVGTPGLDVATKKKILQKYSNFVKANASAVWEVAQGNDGLVCAWWEAPGGSINKNHVSVETHGSGLAAVSCAVRVDRLIQLLET